MTSPEQPTSGRPVAYKGEPLDGERGPGLGCFRFQVVVLVVLLVLTPLTVAWNWPSAVSIALLLITLVLLLFAGQTVIFLLRIVAAARRDGRRVPLAGTTPTVGELEDVAGPGDGAPAGREETVEGSAVAAGTVEPAPGDGAPADGGADQQPGDPGVRE
ncbi:MAG: hypothetical protein MUQ32_04060 [Chloroflexi bacterium]|nr:hypothetical protein [Chloroflexota bacterium]